MKHLEDPNRSDDGQQPATAAGTNEGKAYVTPTLRTLSTRETRINLGSTVTDGLTTS